MQKNKNIYKKAITLLLFVTFFGVVISELVGMHLKLIYDIQFFENNNHFLKPSKDNSNVDKKVICYDLKYSIQSALAKSITENKPDFLETYISVEKICFKKITLQSNNSQLRAPPIC